MKVGIIGYPITGKTSLFEAACEGKFRGDIGGVRVPDTRFDFIVEVTQPKKITPQHIEIEDNTGRIEPGEHKAFSSEFFSNARKMELLLHVVRAFESPFAPYHDDIDPLRDHRNVEDELILADLQVIENRLERLKKVQATHQSGSPEQNEQRILLKLKDAVESSQPIRSVELGEEEEHRIRGFQFLSAKPMICAANISEENISKAENAEQLAPLKAYCAERGIPMVALCATAEKEIAQLEEVDRAEFFESMGITSPASHKLVRAVYDALGLITFFTVGPEEVRAWPLRKGATSVDAAGSIHSDLARGFIRAEVTSYEHMVEFKGLDPAAKAGKMRLEGKEYHVKDGDTVHIRHNM